MNKIYTWACFDEIRVFHVTDTVRWYWYCVKKKIELLTDEMDIELKQCDPMASLKQNKLIILVTIMIVMMFHERYELYCKFRRGKLSGCRWNGVEFAIKVKIV